MPDVGGFEHHARDFHGRPDIDHIAIVIVRWIWGRPGVSYQYSYLVVGPLQFLSAVRNQPTCRVVLLLSL